MGIGPWAQADLIRDIKKSERARVRRAVRRELRVLEESACYPASEAEQAFHRILASIAPKNKSVRNKIDV